MAGRADIQAGGAFVRLFLKDDLTKSFKSAISGIASSVTSVVTQISALSAPVVGAIVEFARFGSEINDMSQRTGASVKNLQEWIFAANQSGAAAEDLEKALRSMAKKGLDTADFEKVGRDIASIVDPSERAAAAIETFGKRGTRLLPMFDELGSLKARSQALGPLLSADEVRMADALGDAFRSLLESIKRFGMQIAATFGPQLLSSFQTAIGMVTALSDAISGKGTQFSGDIIDRLTQFLNTPFTDFQRRGASATNAFRAMGGGAGGEEDARIGKHEKDFDIVKSIVNAEERRLRLMNEFATPHERFLQKEREIIEAIKESNRNRVLSFISPEQAAAERRGLDIALQRARAAEDERQAKLMGKPFAPVEMKAGPEPLPVQFDVATATTAFGAMALGFGGGGSQNRVAVGIEKLVKQDQQALLVLRGIERNAAINKGIFSK